MDKIEQAVKAKIKKQKNNAELTWFNLRNKSGLAGFKRLISSNKNLVIRDTYADQLHELFMSRNPQLRMKPAVAASEHVKFLKGRGKTELWRQGQWVYMSWNNTLVHILEKAEFTELRSARNRDLITSKEQNIFANFRVGIAGLSVGNSVALNLVLEGGGQQLRLADFDELALSNLNRIRGGIQQLTVNKVTMAAQQIYELNPYANLSLFPNGLTDKSMKSFIAGPPKLDVLVDEMDDVVMKMKLRQMARKLRIPVISAADNGDNSIVHIERYDLNPRYPLFHGALEKLTVEKIQAMNFGQRIKLINTMVGIEMVTKRMKDSVLRVGRTLYSWPQLGGAALLGGSVLTYVIRALALKQPLKSGRYDINVDRAFVPGYDSASAKQDRKRDTNEFLKTQEKMFK